MGRGTHPRERKSGGGGGQRGNPKLGDARDRIGHGADAPGKRAAQQPELDPAGDSCRESQAGDSPFALQPQQGRQRQREQIPENDRERHPNRRELQRCPRVAQGVEGRCIEASGGRGQQADARPGQNSPNVGHIPAAEKSGAIEGCDHHVAEKQEGSGRGHHEIGDLLQSARQALAQCLRDLLVSAERARHGGQLGGRDGHAEQAHRQRIDGLRIGERGDRSGRQKTGEQGIDIGADLHHAARNKHRAEVAQHRSNVLSLNPQPQTQRPQEAQYGR